MALEKSAEPLHRHVHLFRDGIVAGLIAAVVFWLVETMMMPIMGNPALMPTRMMAGVLLGQEAMNPQAVGTGSALFFGWLVHLVISLIWGLIYAGLAKAKPWWQAKAGTMIPIALIFGTLVWLIDIQIFARALGFNWFLGANQFIMFMMHAIFFGLPMGIYFWAELRHVKPLLEEERARA